MSNRLDTRDWSLSPPQGWETNRDPECVTLVPPSGEGALQLSSHRKGGAVTESDLLEFADHHLREGAPRRTVELGSFKGFEIAYETDDAAVREWYLRHESVLLFATWFCDLLHAGREDEVVEAALVTLKSRPAKRSSS